MWSRFIWQHLVLMGISRTLRKRGQVVSHGVHVLEGNTGTPSVFPFSLLLLVCQRWAAVFHIAFPTMICSSVTDPKATQPANQRLNPLNLSLKTKTSFFPMSWYSQLFLSQQWKAKIHIFLVFIFFYLLYCLRDFQIAICVLKIMGNFFSTTKSRYYLCYFFLWTPVGRIIADKLLYAFVLSKWAPWSHRILGWILDLCLPNNRTLDWIPSHLQELEWGTFWKPV